MFTKNNPRPCGCYGNQVCLTCGKDDQPLIMDTSIENPTLEQVKQAINNYCEAIKTCRKRSQFHDGKPMYPNLEVLALYGRKFCKIVIAEDGTKPNSVHSFVEISNGVVWKAKSYAAPELNFSRGSVFNIENTIGTKDTWAFLKK